MVKGKLFEGRGDGFFFFVTIFSFQSQRKEKSGNLSKKTKMLKMSNQARNMVHIWVPKRVKKGGVFGGVLEARKVSQKEA